VAPLYDNTWNLGAVVLFSSTWIATGVARIGTSGKGGLLIDFSKRTRGLRFKPQLRVGVAIVP
jgi:hypothetical protein